MNMQEDFACLICTQVALQAVETQCCGQIMCEACFLDVSLKHKDCPNCRESSFTCKPSMIARRMISSIKVPCQHNCGLKIPTKQKQEHERFCQRRPLSCQLCSEAGTVEGIVKHMAEAHPKQLVQLVVSFQQSEISLPSKIKLQKASSLPVTSLSMPEFGSAIRNKDSTLSSLGETGKHYCGKKNLIGKCNCCDGHCGPTNGENCDACMQLDLKKFNLGKGFLVNSQGAPCKLDPTSGRYFCSRKSQRAIGFAVQAIICTPEAPCVSCKQTAYAVNIGRYKSLI